MKLQKYRGITQIKMGWGSGRKVYNKAIYTDGEKFYSLNIPVYRPIFINGKQYAEVKEVNGYWHTN